MDIVRLPVAIASIGFRVQPRQVNVAIVERHGTAFRYGLSRLVIPTALDDARQLAHVRTNLLDITTQHRVAHAGIRTAETVSPRRAAADRQRVMIEGVIMEMLASSPVSSYFHGPRAKMMSRLGMSQAQLGALISGDMAYPGVEEWDQIGRADESREAILAALAAFDN